MASITLNTKYIPVCYPIKASFIRSPIEVSYSEQSISIKDIKTEKNWVFDFGINRAAIVHPNVKENFQEKNGLDHQDMAEDVLYKL